MKKTIVSVAILSAVLCISGNVLAYSGGDGSATTPFQISTLGHWQTLMNTPTDWSKHFVLTANLNFGGLSLTPVGNDSTQFTGVFDGNDKIISNAVINQPGSDNVGLFGSIGTGGQIRNLGVENVNITGRNSVGGLVGRNIFGTLTNCYATGSVNGGSTVGGLVGNNSSGGTLTACYATGSVSGGTGQAGGLVGGNFSPITSCYATGSVSGGTGPAGGLVGWNVRKTGDSHPFL